MANLNLDDLEFAISHSLKLIKNNIKLKTHHYSFPKGLQNSLNNEVIKVLKNNGIKIYPTAIERYNRSVSDFFNLRRLMVL